MKSLLLVLSVLSCQVFATVLGDMQTFAPNTDGLDFITVHSSRPLNKGFFAIGGHFSYAKDHLLVYRTLANQDAIKNYEDQMVEFDLDFAYGLTDRMSVFFAAPNLLWHESKRKEGVKVDIREGVHSYRPGVKYTLGQGKTEFAAILSVDFLNLTNSPYTGIDSNPIFNFELAKTFRAKGFVNYGLNLGYRLREPTAPPVDAHMFPLDDQFTASVGRSAPFGEKSRWVAEGIFSFPIDKGEYRETKDASSIDLLLGFKHRVLRNLNFDWGGSIEPFIDTLAPRYRVFVGLVYYWNPGWQSDTKKEDIPPPVAKEEIYEEAQPQTYEKMDVRDVVELPPLTVTPEYIEVWEGATVNMTVAGGEEPYRFRLKRGSGKLRAGPQTYRAPLKPETAEIEVSDHKGEMKLVQIVVKTPPKPDEQIRIRNLNFKFDTAILVQSSQKEIQRIITQLKNKKIESLIVEGHTDSKGSNEYNLDLSERRAMAVAKILQKALKIPANKVNSIGFGEERPITTNDTEKGRLLNRRCDLKVYWKK